MQKTTFPLKMAVAVLSFAVIACVIGTPAPTATPVPTNTPVPPTDTPLPTATATDVPTPTATPNVAATQQAEQLQALLVELKDKGYVDTTEGNARPLDDFSQDWSDVAHYNWWTVTDQPIGDFVLTGHLNWQTASSNTNGISGCGIIFGLQDNDDFYGVFVDESRIQFTLRRGTYLYDVGVTSGNGRLKFGNPAETDLVLVVKGQKAYVNVQGDYISYTLSADQTSHGILAYTMLSSSATGYGTRCKMTNMTLWTP
ncbi:MAG: hypothetical protein HFACDABA_02096 [Anaerolineales bacterium]|nr:hypothetical protein [Anaerolineales bacterium]